MQTEQPVLRSKGVDDALIVDGSNNGFGAQGVNVPGGLKFQTRAKILHQGGKLVKEAVTGKIPVEYSLTDADSAIVLIATTTSYKNYHDITADADALAAAIIRGASGKSYDALLKAHLADYRKIFDRVTLDLGANADAKLPTDERIRKFQTSDDPALPALYFQFGRYLLIACSRGGQAANLQGIWNSDMRPAWGSKFTININTEMNYWPVGNARLDECAEPLLAMVEDLQVSGARTAKLMYGARGWVAHHNTDLWRAAAPIDYAFSGMWPTGGAWLCNTLYDIYEFTGDQAFLKRLYSPMKGAAEFFLDTLVEDPKHHWLVTNPSLSPENAHHGPRQTCAPGPTIDEQIIRDLFSHCIDASEKLGVDADFRKQLATARARLAPNQIGKDGQLQEWLEDWDAAAPDQQHRHVSHLYGFYPSRQISYHDDNALTDAVRVSLLKRGDIATGWGLGWRLNLWARLHDGEHAYKIVRNLLTDAQASGGNINYTGGGSGVYNNLFDAHPPFQIDGNFGGTAGIAECLLQSTLATADKSGQIELLPALPPQWPNGRVTGLRARGGFLVDQTWKGGKLVGATVRNTGGSTSAQIVYAGKTVDLKFARGATRTIQVSSAGELQ
jgi:alpha-L-fucosidase 2